ncbi:hypothetical protein [Haloglomus halophilum]|uniref:hypothetical protein n=1 Tax=Haloglomus halophilum TaxID=2962672 RepID=UPI0020C9C8B5|nr:hypothetical protein [Haloglomus halophilum]
MSLIQSVTDTVVAAAPQMAAASPTGAAVSGAAAYALVRLAGRREHRPTDGT